MFAGTGDPDAMRQGLGPLVTRRELEIPRKTRNISMN
jgi:hypothetical protein